MKLEPTSYYVNNVVPLKDSVKEFLRLKNPDDYNTSRKTSKCRVQGGVLTDIRYSWLCRGPKLEILHTKTGAKVAAWSFGSVVHDFETFITCVTELPSVQGKLPILIIGLECEIGGGMICMFDINSSRVIRAIQIDDRVAAIHVVNPGCDTSFPGALRAMDGVLAVGTGKGKIILIDLCREICEEAVVNVAPEYVRDEINVCHLIYLSFFDLNNLEMHKDRSLNSGDHLALQINEASTSGVHFALHAPSGEVRLHANMSEVAISALYYCPQLGSLLVGFNFGAFQIYNLLNIQLEYTSPVYEDCIPITHFAIQEPCDDPRAFCYVWVVYNILENGDAGFPMAVMYALAYGTKDFLEGYGHLYQEFNSCSVRFQIELNAVPGFRLSLHKSTPCTGARCISLNAYTKAVVNRQYGAIQDVPDDKLALCSLVWIAWNQNQTETYLTLFDLNQWYKEQMPSSTRLENDALSYVSCESLSELFGLSTDDVNSNLLDVRLDRNSLSPFVCPQRLEEHYYPTALAFQAICVQDTSIVWLGNYGVQRHLLTQLEQAGPLRLLRPSDLFHRCISLGLTPLYTDVLYSVSTPLNLQREMILSVALEHQLVRWLCHCARDWSNGSQSMAGCTLDMLLDWAWQRANTLKFQSDKLCIPLFDHMGTRLDSNALLQLNHCTCQIKHLTTLFETVVMKCSRFLNEQDVDDIKYQMRALQMISTYLEVLQWLLNVGLLPECPLSMYPLPDDSEKMSAPYPAENLARFYETRRAELKSETSNKIRLTETQTNDNSNLLFIDNLIDIECNGAILHNQWECDGGNGLYPPPSLQAVLRAYLVEDIDVSHKHSLLIYLLLDLAMTLDQSRYKPIITHLIKFPAVFKLSPSVIKITQAFWQLDHGDFSTAMTQLLDPSINNEDLKTWHHRIVLNALLLQGQHQHALLYQQVRKPPVSGVQDICMVITLLIVNDLLQEAFHFQRYNRSHFNETEILKHFYGICERMNQQASVLHLPLCPIEETEFINYLKCNQSENNKNFLVIYYLQRDRYGEAFEMNDYLNRNEILKQGLIGQQDKSFRNAIVSGFKKTLPEVTQQLLDYCKTEKEKIVSTNVDRPIPMSVYVHDSKGQTKYKSTLIQASFLKAKELWSTKLQSPNVENRLNNTPFISTPKIFRFSTERKDPSIIYPEMLDSSNIFCDHLDEDATPAKRIKLSPRRSININNESQQFKKRLSCYNSDSLLSTPIVKRRSIRNESNNHFDHSMIGTPPSILKVRSFLRTSKSPEEIRETSTTPEILETTTNPPEKNIKKRTSFGISPRKPLSRTPRPAVHFKERSNSRSSNESGQGDNGGLQIQIDVHREQTPDKSSLIDSKNSSRSTDDVFYSPNSSISLSDNNQQQSNEEISETSKSMIESLDGSSRRSLKRKANDSVSSRRSYKPLTPVTNIQNTSVRESLRSRQSINVETETSKPKETNITIIVTEVEAEEIPEKITPTPINTRIRSRQSVSSKTETTPLKLETPKLKTPKLETPKPQTPKLETPESPKIVPKVSGRRSLSRQVLENNLFAKVVVTPSPRMNTRLSVTKLTDSDKKRGVEVSYSKSTTSIVKTLSDDKIEEKCDVKMIEKKDEFSSEKSDDADSTQVIKHVHNEIETKSNVTKVTEFLEDDVETVQDNGDASHFEEMNVLSFNSDISESDASHFYKSSPHSEKRYSVLLSTSNSDKDQEEAQEDMEVSDGDKMSDQSEDDGDKIEENQVVATNSHDDCIEEMKQAQTETETEVFDADVDEAIEDQDDDESQEDEINIYDDLLEDIPQENMDYDELNSEESEESKEFQESKESEESEGEIQEQIIPEEEAQIAPSSSEDSSQSSEVILISTTSSDSSTESSDSSSSDKTELLPEKNDDDDVENEENEQPSENVSEESEDDKLIEVQTTNKDSESNDNNTSEENFKLTLDESDEEEELETENKLTIDESADDEEMEKEQENTLTLNESVEKEQENKLTLNESVENEEVEKDKNKRAEIMEDINEDNMDKNNEFFINEDIEEMENVEYITEKSNDSESKRSSQINTLAEIHEEESEELCETIAQSQEKEFNSSEANSLDNNVIELLESIVATKKEAQQLEETTKKQNEDVSIVQADQNQLETSETTIKPQTIEESIVQDVEQEIDTNPLDLETDTNPVQQNVIEPQENKESTIQDEEVNPLEQNDIVIEILDSTIKHQDIIILNEEIMDISSNPLEKNIEIPESTIQLHENKEPIIQTEEIEVSESTIHQETTIQNEEIEVNPLEENVIIIEISDSIIKHQDTIISNEEIMDISSNPLEKNIEISKSTIHENEESTIQPEEIEINQLEQNVIEISDSTIKHQEITLPDEEMNVSTNALEQNIIEISESTIQHENESTLQTEEIEVNPLEQNVIEISETTIQHQETTLPDEEMNTSSNPLEQNVIEISESTIQLHENEESSIQIEDVSVNPLELNVIEIHQTPARRTRSASQHSETKKTETPRTPTRSSTRLRSIDQKIEEEPKQKVAQRITKKRSVSVDVAPLEETIEETKTIKTRTRRKSIDDTPKQTRASSVINLEVIEEDKPMTRTRRAASVDPIKERPRRRGQSLEPETTPTIRRGRKRALQSDIIQELQSIPEKIEEYSSTHRLTRHQKSIMEKSLIIQQRSRLEKLKEVEQIDPINLLDKESFTGSPDKEEGSYRAISPASSISTQSSAALNEHTCPSTPKRKRGRPSLTGTPGSSTNTDSTSVVERPRRRSFTQAQQAMAATTPPPRATRSSRATSHDQDDAASVVSVSSVMSVPVVQLKQLREKDLVRHRSLSPTALVEEGKNRRRSARSSILPINLSKINEEANVEPNEEKPRRGRHRKTNTGSSSSQSEFSGLKSTLRRSSYKPLENYLPEHAVVKTRKTFKIRKFSRGGSSSP